MTSIERMKQELTKQYPYRIELHAHTKPVSGCSDVLPEELVASYARRGYHGVVITNHFFGDGAPERKKEYLSRYWEDYEKAAEAGKQAGLSVFLGAEVRFTENSNDYLLYGVDREILETCYDYLDKGVEAYRTCVHLPQSVFLQAHPFRWGMELCRPEFLDGVECLNVHPHHNSQVAVATRYAYDQRLSVKTAGTDFHHHGHEALSAIRVRQMPKDSFALAEILKEGDYLFEIAEHSLWLP